MNELATAAILDKVRSLHQRGDLAAARMLGQEVLAAEPGNADALNLVGVLSGQLGDLAAALACFDRAIAVQPGNAAAYCNRGLTLQLLEQWDLALESFERAINLDGGNVAALFSRGNILKQHGDFLGALRDYDAAIIANPQFAQAHFNRGLILQQRRDLRSALAAYDRTLEINPNHAEAHANRGFVLHQSNRLEPALASYDRSIALNPTQVLSFVHKGNALRALSRVAEALQSFDCALAVDPQFAQAYNCRGLAFSTLGEIDTALANFDRAIEIRPDYAEAFFNRATLQREAGRLAQALADYESAHKLDPGLEFLTGALLECKLQMCEWESMEEDLVRLSAGIMRREAVASPFSVLALVDSPSLQRSAAEVWVRETCPSDDSLGVISARPHGTKLRIGYFSADFRDHPVPRLLTELIEAHDRSRFEVVAFSLGIPTPGKQRDRLLGAFDQFLDVNTKTNLQIAALSRDLKIDIAVDLGGFTLNSRPGIFALRAAPVQVGYLGYLGTMAAPYMDYLIADEVVVPPEQRRHYTESILYIPTYQVNDSKRPLPNRSFTRRDLGLPETGFVFSCFNSTYKITPGTFASWMRVLKRVDGSVLFVYADNDFAKSNLRRQAENKGIDPHRIVYGDRLSVEDYLARFRSMDLFLDTFPYNAGTTASDALWAGLPVLTRRGDSFAARVASSVLTALDMQELITDDAKQYERVAVLLASNPALLAELRETLSRNRGNKPLFDTLRFTRNLESGLQEIHQRHLSGFPPTDIRVAGKA